MDSRIIFVTWIVFLLTYVGIVASARAYEPARIKRERELRRKQ